MADGIYGAVIEAEDGRWHAAYVRAPGEIENHMLWDAWDPECSEPAERWSVAGPFATPEEAERYVPPASGPRRAGSTRPGRSARPAGPT